MESTPDWMAQGAGNLLPKQSCGLLMLWGASVVAVVFVLYLIIYPLVVNYLRRRGAAQVSKIPALRESDLRRSSAPVQGDYLETACNNCMTNVFVPKARRCKPFFCPNCSQTNPPPKKESLGWAKSVLRKLLYPSFQDLF